MARSSLCAAVRIEGLIPPFIFVVNIFRFAAAAVSRTPTLRPRSGKGLTMVLIGIPIGLVVVRADEVGVVESRVKFLCISMLQKKNGKRAQNIRRVTHTHVTNTVDYYTCPPVIEGIQSSQNCRATLRLPWRRRSGIAREEWLNGKNQSYCIKGRKHNRNSYILFRVNHKFICETTANVDLSRI